MKVSAPLEFARDSFITLVLSTVVGTVRLRTEEGALKLSILTVLRTLGETLRVEKEDARATGKNDSLKLWKKSNTSFLCA